MSSTEIAFAHDELATEAVNSTSLVLEQAYAIKIKNDQDFADAGDFLRDLKTRAAEIDDLRKTMTKPLDEAKQRIMDFFRPATKRLQDAEIAVKSAISGYTQEQKRRRLEEQARAEEALRKERERLQAEAEKLRAKGRDELAEAKQQTAEMLTGVVIPAAPDPAATGVITRTVWRAEVIEIIDLCRAVADGRASTNFIQPNMTALDAWARAVKATFDVPGCRAVEDQIVAARRR